MAEQTCWDLDKLKQMVECYCLAYRNPKLDLLEVSKEYKLDIDWKEDKSWPNAESAGVYAIFGKTGLLYIGKASFNSSVGIRLSTYFKNDNDKDNGGIPQDDQSWEEPPTYVVTIPTKYSWEAPALEEFLILQAEPTGNSIGNAK
jgi:hypothetical protein